MSPRSHARDVIVTDDPGDDQAIGSVPDYVVDQATGLVRAIRDTDPTFAVEDYTNALSWGELRTLAVVLAALVPADIDPARALEWINEAPKDWSDATVVREDGRWEAGARDITAARGRGQMKRRIADMHHATTPGAGS